ncbi:MAG: hypothetical protein M3Z98_10255 [Candidatus Dormibacteraeota bacterium]|nr:hypothetical protein [Candidatus Dormibacteraeota bacterium]
MPAWTLKLTACLLTGLATVGSAVYVGGHLKSASAPLHPPVAAATTGHLNLTPSIKSSGDQQPLTFTSVS